MDAWIWAIVIGVIAALIVIAAAVAARQQARLRRSRRLREEFGGEYDRALDMHGSRKEAERALLWRKRRIERLHLRPLSADERSRFRDAWQAAQSRFVDEPTRAVEDAGRLVDAVMRARGYPTADIERRMADVSVEHAGVVEHYRAAREIADRNERGEAGTEDLRQAMVHDRVLFQDLLAARGDVPELTPRRGERSHGRAAPRAS